MDINQNLEQINTFEKGMNTDVSDTLLPNNQYRYAENLRFTSHDTDNTGELQPIKDMSLIYDIGEPIIATSQIRDIAVFITGTRSSWKIQALNKKFNNQDIQWMDIPFSTKTVIFGPCTDTLGEHVSIVTRYENDKDIKVYIADGLHQLMSINIMHNDGYGAAAPKDIKYLTSYSDILLSQAQTAIVNTSGGLKPAVIQYTYLLYKEGGAVTKYAPFTHPIYLLNDEGEGYLPTEPTNKAVQININVTAPLNGLDHIQVYRITYSQYGQDPEIYLIYEDEFHGTLEYIDNGVNIVSYGKNEFLKQETYDKIKPAVIESKGNYLFAGNIEDFQDEIDAQWKDINFQSEEYIKISLATDNTYEMMYDGKLYGGEYHSSLMPGETYEYGIVLYDNLGRRSSVKFLKEVSVPDNVSTIHVVETTREIELPYKYVATPIGINVKFVKDIPNCSGYEIVRCLRGVNESKTLYQGLIGFPIADKLNISTPSFLTRTLLYPCADYVKSVQDVCIFACPECVYLPNETQNRMSSVNTSVKHVRNYNIPIENISQDAFNYVDANSGHAGYGDYFLDHTGTQQTEFGGFSLLDPSGIPGSIFIFGDIGEEINHSLDSDFRNRNWNLAYYDDGNTPYCATLNLAVGKSLSVDDEQKRATFKINLPTQLGREYYYKQGSVQNEEDGGTLISEPFYIDIDLTGPVLHDQETESGEILPYTCPYAYTDPFRGRVIMTWSSYIDPVSVGVSEPEYRQRIKNFKVIDSFKPGDILVQNEQFVGHDLYSYVVGKYTYTNFVKETRLINWVGGFEYGNATWCSTYAGGKAMLINTENPIPTSLDPKVFIDQYPRKIEDVGITQTPVEGSIHTEGVSDNIHEILSVSVANIVNDSYTGYGALESLSFCSFGNYYTYDSGTSRNIYDGDTYINVFRYNHTHTIQQADKYQVGASVIYMIPLQSTIDLMKASGDVYPDVERDHNYFFQDYMGNMFKLYQQERDAYIYNAAYSQEMNLMTYHPVTRTQVHSGKFDTRIKVSEEKQNGEKFDSWLNFDVVNTLDADTRFGEITHMRLFKDYLLFWQKEATGVVSVNERVIVQDMNDTSLLLGTGGVLQRFDYISTKYGMQVPYVAETQSDTTLYFWDSYKKEILAYSGGQQVQPMVEAKTIKNYINNHKNIEQPCFVYDSDHNEIIMRAVETMPIVYNEFVNQFTSVYDYSFTHSVYFNDKLWLTWGQRIYEPNAGDYIESYLSYAVNKSSTYVKVFDNVRMGVNQVSNDYLIQTPFELPREQDINYLQFRFKSPQQYSETQVNITDREYDYRFAVPRAQLYSENRWNNPSYGQRMRGKYLITDLTIPEHPNTTKNAFSLQYIITKFRISYS